MHIHNTQNRRWASQCLLSRCQQQIPNKAKIRLGMPSDRMLAKQDNTSWIKAKTSIGMSLDMRPDTYAERRDAYRPDTDIRLWIRPRWASVCHTTRCWQPDYEHHNANTWFQIMQRVSSGWHSTRHMKAEAEHHEVLNQPNLEQPNPT
jgi:hypothetical protein